VRPLHTRRTSVLALLAAVAWLSAPTVGAAHRDTLSRSPVEAARRPHVGYSATSASRDPHVRMEDSRLKKLLAEGTAASPTLRRLVDRLDQSDVIVYFACDQQLRNSIAGRLSFVGVSAGSRYLRARIGYLGARLRQIALMSHELQHAVEVADTPDIIDEPSFEREYRRMGFVNHAGSSPGTVAYETEAATATAEQVLRELLRGT